MKFLKTDVVTLGPDRKETVFEYSVTIAKTGWRYPQSCWPKGGQNVTVDQMGYWAHCNALNDEFDPSKSFDGVPQELSGDNFDYAFNLRTNRYVRARLHGSFFDKDISGNPVIVGGTCAKID